MRRVALIDELARVRPDVAAHEVIVRGRVIVDGRVVTKPGSRVPRGCSIVVRPAPELRGTVKLRAALEALGIDVEGRVALDVGASAGGFVTVLLERGARFVYAVDAGHGQLLGSLRQDPRVRNLEATNVAALDREKVPDDVDLVTVDVSYLSLAGAVGQLDRIGFAPHALLIGLVKPMFELRLPRAPDDDSSLQRALAAAIEGIEAAGWSVVGSIRSPARGAKGAPELFVAAERSPGG